MEEYLKSLSMRRITAQSYNNKMVSINEWDIRYPTEGVCLHLVLLWCIASSDYRLLGIRYPAGNRAGKPSGNCLSFMYVWHDPPGGLFFQKWDERWVAGFLYDVIDPFESTADHSQYSFGNNSAGCTDCVLLSLRDCRRPSDLGF